MECTSRRFVITVEILLDLWRRDIHDGKIGPTVVQKMLEKFQFLFFLFEIDTQRQQGLIFQSTNNILSSVLFIRIRFFFQAYRKSEFFPQDFEIGFFLNDSGQVNGNPLSFSRGTKYFTFKRSSLFRGHAKYVSSVIASHLLN